MFSFRLGFWPLTWWCNRMKNKPGCDSALIRWDCFYFLFFAVYTSEESLDVRMAQQKHAESTIWRNLLCTVCVYEREVRERCVWQRERRERDLMVTQHNRVCGACMTSFIKLTSGSVSAPLWCDSQGEKDQEHRKRRERRGGREGGVWGEAGPRALKWESVSGRKNRSDKQKTWVNKSVSEITNRERGDEIVEDKQWRSEEREGGTVLLRFTTVTTSKHNSNTDISSAQCKVCLKIRDTT